MKKKGNKRTPILSQVVNPRFPSTKRSPGVEECFKGAHCELCASLQELSGGIDSWQRDRHLGSNKNMSESNRY